MKLPSARSVSLPARLFTGTAVDRNRPLRFRLDGRPVSAFAGDSVLSALLGHGIDTAGMRQGFPVALTARHAPAILPVGAAGDTSQALPMERTAATEGADYTVLAPRLRRAALGNLFGRERHSLGLDLDAPDALTRPWLGIVGEKGPETDLVIVGGGVAGMAAAIAGAKRGLRVTLLEATARLGGHTRLFGTADGEETPDQAIASLSQAVFADSRITVLTSAEVFALHPGLVRFHQVRLEQGHPAGRVIDISARLVIVATGAFERLPVFPGNRLPGVMGALEAFELANHYGIWPGESAVFATSSSSSYRLAMQAKDKGIDIRRILDARSQPQSRFIEFSKAYGITQAQGSVVGAALPALKGRGLDISPQLSVPGLAAAEASLRADRLVVGGNWQPDLTLWHMAGGESRWNESTARLEATHAPAGVALAGSAAGWITRSACLASGADAVNLLLGRERKPVQDPVIDPLYETPDGATPIGAEPADGSPPAYLDGGHGYLARPTKAPQRRLSRWPFARHSATWSLADTPQPLDTAEVAAGVQLGAIPAASAGIVAQERVAMIAAGKGDVPAPASSSLPLPPPYVMGRHRGAALFVIKPLELRRLQAGALIYRSSDEADPLASIGTVIRATEDGAIALVAGSVDQVVSVREGSRAIPVRLVERYGEGVDLAAALGSGASAP